MLVLNESQNERDELYNAYLMHKDELPADFDPDNLYKRGTAEYESNVNRKKRIAFYRQCAGLNDNDIITEDNLHEGAINETIGKFNRERDRIISELLGRKWTNYEVD